MYPYPIVVIRESGVGVQKRRQRSIIATHPAHLVQGVAHSRGEARAVVEAGETGANCGLDRKLGDYVVQIWRTRRKLEELSKVIDDGSAYLQEKRGIIFS